MRKPGSWKNVALTPCCPQYHQNSVAIALNVLITAAVALSYPVQFYAAIILVESYAGVEGAGGGGGGTSSIIIIKGSAGGPGDRDSIEVDGQPPSPPRAAGGHSCVAGVVLRLAVVALTALVGYSCGAPLPI